MSNIRSLSFQVARFADLPDSDLPVMSEFPQCRAVVINNSEVVVDRFRAHDVEAERTISRPCVLQQSVVEEVLEEHLVACIDCDHLPIGIAHKLL